MEENVGVFFVLRIINVEKSFLVKLPDWPQSQKYILRQELLEFRFRVWSLECGEARVKVLQHLVICRLDEILQSSADVWLYSLVSRPPTCRTDLTGNINCCPSLSSLLTSPHSSVNWKAWTSLSTSETLRPTGMSLILEQRISHHGTGLTFPPSYVVFSFSCRWCRAPWRPRLHNTVNAALRLSVTLRSVETSKTACHVSSFVRQERNLNIPNSSPGPVTFIVTEDVY